MKKMTTVTRRGSRKETLDNLALQIASKMDKCESDAVYSQLARQYRETLKAIDELDIEDEDDAVTKIIEERQADGKSVRVR